MTDIEKEGDLFMMCYTPGDYFIILFFGVWIAVDIFPKFHRWKKKNNNLENFFSFFLF